MCGVSRLLQWHRRITDAALRSSMKLQPLAVYVQRRRLGWLGRLAAQPLSSPPRALLTAFLPLQRRVGATYGSLARSYVVTLKHAGILPLTRAPRGQPPGPRTWLALALDKARWNTFVDGLINIPNLAM
jgi:hypothetical protein